MWRCVGDWIRRVLLPFMWRRVDDSPTEHCWIEQAEAAEEIQGQRQGQGQGQGQSQNDKEASGYSEEMSCLSCVFPVLVPVLVCLT